MRPGDPWRISKKADPVETWAVGMAGEFLVSRALGVPMPQRYDTKVETDGGFGDLMLPNGQTVSVKVLKREEDPFGLYTSDPNDFRDDYGVLVWYVGGEYILVGYFDQKTWKEHWRKHRYAPHLPERAVLDYVWMRPIDELRHRIEEMRG